ncbi:phosphoglycerate kinase [Candidatus Parcubacteria bacterium]|nr:phosphoglycerate kinase [Candidatus Parcubacteria bacterium]
MNLRKIQDVKKELKGARVICRVDFNVPIKESGIVMSDFRIKATLPTINFLKEAGAKIILISHIGRAPNESLAPVANYLKQNLGMNVDFVSSIFGSEIEDKIDSLEDGGIVMLENLRSDPGETSNDSFFSKQLAEYADIYVNDAFAVSHREHASIVGLPKEIPAFAGLRMQEEINHLLLKNMNHPVLAVIGGLKFETKEPLVERLLDDVESLYLCGALAHDFYRAEGFEIGTSVHGDSIPKDDLIENKKITIPSDVLVENGARKEYKKSDQVLHNEKIVDIGTESLEELKELSRTAKTIIWNGPFGWYEGGYDKGTIEYLEFLADLDSNIIIGGGDTVGLIEKMSLINRFSFVSTGGGAMLEFLEKGSLVALEYLKDK